MARRKLLFVLLVFIALAGVARAAENGEDANPEIEARSPDGLFGFRYVAETAETGRAFDLIKVATGERLLRVAEGDVDPGPSARFSMEVLWRADSQAFALTATFWKRSTSLSIFVRAGETFREVELPELRAEITQKMKAGKSYPHIVEEEAARAVRWRKDGSLAAEVESIQDGEGDTITLRRTVILSVPKAGAAKVLESTAKVMRD